jgi:hypothetical protein
MSRYSNLRDTYSRLFYGNSPTPEQVAEIENLIARNAELPRNATAMRGALSLMKTDEEIIQELTDFQSAYLTAISDELEMGISSAQRATTLEYAMRSPTMDLSLISNSQVRRQLDEQFQTIVRGSRSVSKFWTSSCVGPVC